MAMFPAWRMLLPSLFSSEKNFWMVAKTTPPAGTASSSGARGSQRAVTARKRSRIGVLPVGPLIGYQ
jgi:hypothetical protein